jgi:Skp family chaperone for outer membrane proteins
MTVRRPLLAFALALGLLLPAMASAQALKIAFVDTTRAAANSSEGKSADQYLKDLRERKREEFRPKDEKIKRMRDEYETQRFVLSKEALQEREIELMKQQRNLERDLEEAQEEFEIEQRKRMQPILKSILKVVDEIARDESYGVVFEKTSPGVLFYSDGLDITDKVIERLK